MKRKQPIKIKHRKYNLYTKKKSTAAKVWTIILMVIVVIALCVLGFGLGRPIVEYFQNRDKNPDSGSSAWTPPQTTTSAPQTTDSTDTTTVDDTSEPEPEIVEQSAYVLPENAALTVERLNSAIGVAKQNGCNAVVITFKDSDGDYMYKTEIPGIKDTPLVLGSLTAKEIYDIANNAGMTPLARFTTLKDHKSGAYVEGIRYLAIEGWTWLDDYAELGGQSWLSPYEPNTANFIASITSEIAAAGFEQIILSDTVYPMFRDMDYGFLADIGDERKRVDSLWNVITASNTIAANSNAKLLVEVDSEALFADNKLSTTAEIAINQEKLRSVKLLIRYSGAGYADAKQFISRMNATYNGVEYDVLIDNSSVSPSVATEVEKAFVESSVTVFSE